MSPKEGNALLMILGKGGDKKPGGPSKDDPPGKPAPDKAGENYDADLKTALGDLASALGVQVKDARRGVEALKTIHDLCDRASGETE